MMAKHWHTKDDLQEMRQYANAAKKALLTCKKPADPFDPNDDEDEPVVETMSRILDNILEDHLARK